MDQDRQEAKAWALEWQIRNKNRKIRNVLLAIVLLVVLYFAVSFIVIKATRTTYPSEEAMRAALQGRFETDYCEDIEIIGDDITVTYYEISHYDRDYAETYGYSQYGDAEYEDTIEKWDYRRGIIRGRWMSDIKVDRDGNLVYYSQTYVKSNDPKPTPLDPSTLNLDNVVVDPYEDELPAEELSQESLEQTEDAAEDAGVMAADAGQ